jgi:hypothetical protein
MNERIKNLIKQAGGIGYDDDNNELTPVLVGKGLEKFAELIVRECGKIVEQTAGKFEPDIVAETMRMHFGVE